MDNYDAIRKRLENGVKKIGREILPDWIAYAHNLDLIKDLIQTVTFKYGEEFPYPVPREFHEN